MQEKLLSTIPVSELEVISLSEQKNNISWEEEGKEFMFKGLMYDVVKSTNVNGRVMLYCINDIKEKKIIDRYNSITKNNSDSGKKSKDTRDESNLMYYDFNEPRRDHFFTTGSSYPTLAETMVNPGFAGFDAPPPRI